MTGAPKPVKDGTQTHLGLPLRYGQEAWEVGAGQVEVRGRCYVTGQEYKVTVPLAGLKLWLRGALIQDALPELPKDQREFLISGTSPEGWAVLFPEEDDDAEA